MMVAIPKPPSSNEPTLVSQDPAVSQDRVAVPSPTVSAVSASRCLTRQGFDVNTAV